MTTKKNIQIAVSFLIGGGIIWFLFGDTDWREVFVAVKNVHIGWLLLHQAAIWVSFFARVQRWSYIVRAVKKVAFWPMLSATQIGFLANFTLPARAGEFVRAVVLGRLTGLPFTKTIGLVALDRVTDLVGLIVVMFIAMAAYRPAANIILPKDLFGTPIEIPANTVRAGAISIAGMLIGLIAVFVLLYISKTRVIRACDFCIGRFSQRLASYCKGVLNNFADSLHIFRSAGDMTKSIGYSLVVWTTFVVATFALLNAFGVKYPWYTPFVVQSFLPLALSIPGPPGFVGPFHFGIIGALYMSIPDINPDTAKAVAIVGHLANLFPVVLFGTYCLFRDQFHLLELSRERDNIGTLTHADESHDMLTDDSNL